MRLRNVGLAAATLAAFGVSAAKADTVSLYFDTVSPGVGETISANGGVSTEAAGTGVYNWWVQSITNSSPGTNPFVAAPYPVGPTQPFFCIDVNAGVNQAVTGTFTVEYAPTPAISNGTFSKGNADVLYHFFAKYRNSVVDSTTAAAFQLAMWEIVYDHPGVGNTWTYGGLTELHSGTFQVTGNDTAVNLANTWLSSTFMNSNISSWIVVEVTPLDPRNNQAQIWGYDTSVPVPAAAWTGLSTLAGISVMGFLRKRARSS